MFARIAHVTFDLLHENMCSRALTGSSAAKAPVALASDKAKGIISELQGYRRPLESGKMLVYSTLPYKFLMRSIYVQTIYGSLRQSQDIKNRAGLCLLCGKYKRAKIGAKKKLALTADDRKDNIYQRTEREKIAPASLEDYIPISFQI